MNREEKTQLLSELNELFNNSDSMVVVHYKGITVKDADELRNSIRKAGAGFKVTKNRITRLALKDTKFENLSDLFTGPTAIAFADEPVAVSKACVDFAKTNKNFVVLGGSMGGKALSDAEVMHLASLPTLEEVRGKLVGLIQAPAAQLARVTKAYAEKEEAAA